MKITKNRPLPLAKIVVIAVFVAVVLGILIYFWGKQTGMIAGKTSKLPMTVQTINDKTELYTIKAEYPVFSSNLVQLNKAIEKDITFRIDEFKRQASENWDIMKDDLSSYGTPSDSPFSFFLSWTPKQVNKRYVSFVMNISWFPGGANMAQDFVTFNWDVKKNIPVLLGDVFYGKPDYLQAISTYARNDLKKQFIANGIEEKQTAEDMLNEGTAPAGKNFSLFTFDDKTVTFYFPKYQVAPGAFGPQTVVMERK